MGLDMYWFAKKTPEEKAEALITGEDPERGIEIGYFRNFHTLNNFMGSLYSQEVGDFNTVRLVIGWDALATMKTFELTSEAIEEDDEFVADDLKEYADICKRIEEALLEGREVYYWPWW